MRKEIRYEINYKDDVVIESGTTSDTMYFLRLDSNDPVLDNKFESMNNSFERVLKIVPAYGETVESKLESIMDGYSYKILKGEGQAEYVSGVVDDNLRLWIEVGVSVEVVDKSIEEFFKGGFVINTSF